MNKKTYFAILALFCINLTCENANGFNSSKLDERYLKVDEKYLKEYHELEALIAKQKPAMISAESKINYNDWKENEALKLFDFFSRATTYSKEYISKFNAVYTLLNLTLVTTFVSEGLCTKITDLFKRPMFEEFLKESLCTLLDGLYECRNNKNVTQEVYSNLVKLHETDPHLYSVVKLLPIYYVSNNFFNIQTGEFVCTLTPERIIGLYYYLSLLGEGHGLALANALSKYDPKTGLEKR